MAGTTAQAQVEKKAYRNQTAGWLGVVKLDHLGAQIGHPVEPHGTVYLSDEEAILTARAPREAKDNPFVEQSFWFQDGNGVRSEKMLAPLVLITDDEDVPTDDRYVPVGAIAAAAGGSINPAKVGAEAARTDDALEEQETDPRAVPSEPVAEPTLVPSSSGAVPHTSASPAPVEEELLDLTTGERAESWVEAPDRSTEPKKGSLGGTDAPPPGDVKDPAEKSPGQAPPQRPAPTSVASSQAAPPAATEEFASTRSATTPSESAGTAKSAGAPSEQEETGAAVPARGDAPQGEYAQHEEVGSPDAPAKAGESA